MSALVLRYAQRALGHKFGAHTLRHTLAVHLADDSDGKPPMPVRRIQELLGHEDVATTVRYVHAVEGGLRESYERAVPAF